MIFEVTKQFKQLPEKVIRPKMSAVASKITGFEFILSYLAQFNSRLLCITHTNTAS